VLVNGDHSAAADDSRVSFALGAHLRTRVDYDESGTVDCHRRLGREGGTLDKGKGVVRWITTEELELTVHYDGGMKQSNVTTVALDWEDGFAVGGGDIPQSRTNDILWCGFAQKKILALLVWKVPITCPYYTWQAMISFWSALIVVTVVLLNDTDPPAPIG
jgi:hypothetical protein